MSRAWVIGLSALVTLAALADLRVACRADRAPVSAGVMQSALERVHAIRMPGDLVVHSPLFTPQELAPLGRLDARPDRPKAILQSRRRVLAIDFRASPMFGLGTPVAEQSLGEGLVLRTYPPTGDPTGAAWTLAEGLTRDTMFVERDGRRRPCQVDRPEGGFSCAGEPEWLYAAVRVLRIERQDQECVWAHPTTGGTVILRIPPAVPTPGHRLQLEVEAAMNDDAVVNTPDGAAVVTEVFQGRSLGLLKVPNQTGWFDSTFPLVAGQEAELRITTPRDGRRHHCIRAQVVEVR